MHSRAVIPLKKSRCPVCGVSFVRQCSAAAWGYAYDGRLVCSYKCMRAAEKADREREEEPALTKEEREQIRRERDEKICRLRREGLSQREIAETVGMSCAGVHSVLAKNGVNKEEPKMADENTAPMNGEAEDLRGEIAQLKKQLAEQTTLAGAAIDLMMIWKERYELNERSRTINSELNAKEKTYFEALRAARGNRREDA